MTRSRDVLVLDSAEANHYRSEHKSGTSVTAKRGRAAQGNRHAALAPRRQRGAACFGALARTSPSNSSLETSRSRKIADHELARWSAQPRSSVVSAGRGQSVWTVSNVKPGHRTVTVIALRASDWSVTAGFPSPVVRYRALTTCPLAEVHVTDLGSVNSVIEKAPWELSRTEVCCPLVPVTITWLEPSGRTPCMPTAVLAPG